MIHISRLRFEQSQIPVPAYLQGYYSNNYIDVLCCTTVPLCVHIRVCVAVLVASIVPDLPTARSARGERDDERDEPEEHDGEHDVEDDVPVLAQALG